MTALSTYIDIILHLDTYIGGIIRNYGAWTYPLLFVVIFCETGLVITPFLPGDSLLFVTGTFAAAGFLDIRLLFALLCVAAILGDTINYWIGTVLGPKAFRSEGSRFFHKHNLDEAQEFYEQHGAKAIVLARFVPIVRTFAPFVAGIAKMDYGRFLLYNITGAIQAECTSAQDCTPVSDGCCPCTASGKQKSMSVHAAKTYLSEQRARCAGTMCAQAISNDPTCAKKVVCRASKCELE